jgi:hypothetical protein
MVLKEKTGFSSSLPFKIYDKAGWLFYADFFTKHIANGDRLKFNLPTGEYRYDGFLEKLPEPVKHKEIKLPPPQRNFPKVEYKVKFGDNPAKCSIFYKKHEILFDNSFKDVPIYMRVHVYYHEKGHLLYKTEEFADLYSAKKMLDLGYNTSQIGYSNLEMLSEAQKERKEFLVNNILGKYGNKR